MLFRLHGMIGMRFLSQSWRINASLNAKNSKQGTFGGADEQCFKGPMFYVLSREFIDRLETPISVGKHW